MFGFIETIPPDEGKRAKRREKRQPPIYRTSLYSSSFGRDIYRITVKKRQDAKEYDVFPAKYALLRGRLVAPENEVFPDSVKTMLYNPENYRRQLLALSARQLIESSFEKGKLHLVIADSSGKFARYLEELVPFAARIDVITKNRRQYAAKTLKIYSDYGLAIGVYGESLIQNPDLLIAADIHELSGIKARRIVTPDNIFVNGGIRIARVKPPSEIIIPRGIDSIRFAGAAAELNKDEKAAALTACAYEYRGRIISRSAAIELMSYL